MLKGFKNFILKGNVVDLAVAVAIGVAFTALITAFGDAFIKPAVGLAGGGGVSGGSFTVRGQVFNWSLLINAIVIFVITAAVIYFLIVLPLGKLAERLMGKQKTSSEMAEEELALLSDIRDLLQSQRREGQ